MAESLQESIRFSSHRPGQFRSSKASGPSINIALLGHKHTWSPWQYTHLSLAATDISGTQTPIRLLKNFVFLQPDKSIDHEFLGRIADVAFVSEAFPVCAAYGHVNSVPEFRARLQ